MSENKIVNMELKLGITKEEFLNLPELNQNEEMFC